MKTTSGGAHKGLELIYLRDTVLQRKRLSQGYLWKTCPGISFGFNDFEIEAFWPTFGIGDVRRSM
jgi:hypothetical protein